ncbi:hypothetical protein CLV92_11910 [Kineococcus xinjiangensis]|uniref:Uncharacterized protein n=1 Tax=Kineococcus xinjiangensis TaxID=512762 RepID=A0A2S6ICK0_9ACTN|nr:hypothetical protein [Kineococcus xinjiangensis]PPK91929.1 hypothetical protein CLV92_11910 [Kineococcus xinjiangensis]
MSETPTPEQALSAARALLDEKMANVERLTETRKRCAELRQQLEEAERADAVQWAEALRAGWSEDELKRCGLGEPARKKPGRPRQSRSSRKSASVGADGGAGQ